MPPLAIKMKTEILSTLQDHLPQVIWGAVSALALIATREILASLPTGFFATLPSKPLLILLLLSVLINILASCEIYLLKRLKLKDGVFWNKTGQPHCVACKIPLTPRDYFPHRKQREWECLKCSKKVFLPDDQGQLP